MSQILIRFLVGGAVVSVFALIGDLLKPKSFAGLFGAAPSVALATLGLTVATEGASYAASEARSMMAGAIALTAYASCVSWVNLDFPVELGRLHKDVEIALFRAVQEALTNVHRHSDGSAVDITLRVNAKKIRLEVKDDGRGIPRKHLKRLTEGAAVAGVGIAGMRERVRELGGSLEIQSKGEGTKVIITVPLLEKLAAQSMGDGDPKRSVSAA